MLITLIRESSQKTYAIYTRSYIQTQSKEWNINQRNAKKKAVYKTTSLYISYVLSNGQDERDKKREKSNRPNDERRLTIYQPL